MLREKRIGIIGAGGWGGALCRGLIAANAAPAERVLVSDPDGALLSALAGELRVKTTDSNLKVAKFTDVTILAVAPVALAATLAEVGDALRPEQLLLCVMEGARLADVEAAVKAPVPIVWAVMNGAGFGAFCRGKYASDVHAETAAAVLGAIGTAVEVAEETLPAVAALASPVYAWLMIEALIDGAVNIGLPRAQARSVAVQALLGAAKTIAETDRHPAQLRDEIATPRSAATVALASLERAGFRAALMDAQEEAALSQGMRDEG